MTRAVPGPARWPRPTGRVLVVVGALVAALVVWAGAPALLRRSEFFRVRQIELVGVRHLAPDAATPRAALGLTTATRRPCYPC